jgi:hypothetical protein
MKLVPTRTKAGKPAAVNPFGALAEKGGQPAGPGVGAPRAGIMGPLTNKRVRVANQVLGDTPPRDGPFSVSAAPVAIAMPPRARKKQERKGSGANPFGQAQPKRS